MTDQRPGTERRPWQTDVEWKRLAARIVQFEASRQRPPWYRRKGIAAAAVLVVAVGYGALRTEYVRSGASPEPIQIVRTAAGQRRTVRLSDSSLVDLGPATTLRYRMSAGARRVELAGLARFTVVHDPKRAFVVSAGNARAIDVGTTFTVRAYEADSVIVVAVTEGRVSLASDSARAALMLPAGSSARVGRDGIVRADAAPDAGANAAWVDGTLQFRNATLREAALELSRWFDVDVRIADRTLGERRINALYTTPTLAGVLDALTVTVSARYEQHGRSVVLFPRKP